MPRKAAYHIPKFDANGNLPSGVYHVTLKDIGGRLVWNARRKRLFSGLKRAIANLAAAGVKKVWIDGSFVTPKDKPNGIDGCWEYDQSVNVNKLDAVFLDRAPPREAMRRKYGVDFLISARPLVDAPGKTVEEFFQVDKDGNPKGILIVEVLR